MTGGPGRLDERPFHHLASRLADFILQTDLEGTILYLNRTDGMRDREDYVGSSVCDWVASENREAVQEALERAVRTKHETEIDYRFLTPGEEETWHSAHITPLVINGKIDSLVLVVRDISERRRSEKEMEQRNRELAGLLNVSQKLAGRLRLDELTDAIVASIVEVLPAAERASLWLYDDERDEMAVRAWAGHPDEAIAGLRLSPCTSLVGLVYRTQQPHIVDEARCNRSFVMLGRPALDSVRSVLGVPLLLEGQPIGALFADNFSRPSAFAGSDLRMLQSLAGQAAVAIENARLYEAMKLELSQRKRAEEALATSELRYRELADSIVDIFFGMDENLRYTYWNRASEELTGIAAHEALGKSLHDLFPDSAQTRAAERVYREVLNSQEPRTYIQEYSLTGKDYSFEITASPSEGGLSVFVRDITERKRASEALERHSLELEHSNRLVTSLSRVATQLQTSLEADQIMHTLGDELAKLDLTCLIGVIDKEAGETEIAYMSIPNALAEEADRLTGETSRHLRFPTDQLSALRLAIREGSPVFLDRLTATALELFPGVPRHLLAKAFELIGLGECTPAILLPMHKTGKVEGFLGVWGPGLQEGDGQIFSIFASQVAIALENAHLFTLVQEGRSRLQALAHRQVEAQELERRHIARELHDQIGQILTGLKLTLEMSHHLAPKQARQNLIEAQGAIDELLAKVRELSLELRPSMLDDLGLLPALKWHFERYSSQTGVQVRFHHGGLEGERFGSEVETATYRIVQEALTNVARHADIGQVDVDISADRQAVHMRIEDAGMGFDAHHVHSSGTSGGLSGMRERAVALGGQFQLESEPGSGVQLKVSLPLSGRQERRGKDRKGR
jgi:PAS domain S-box-containing protein